MEQQISAAGVVKAANKLQQSDVFAELQQALRTEKLDSPQHQQLQQAAESLVGIISGIKSQQNSDAAFLAHQQFIALANNELSDIRNEMLMAVNKVLDGADALSEALENLPEADQGKANENVGAIYEACSFQDITGQRIQNLLKAVSEIEEAMAGSLLNAGNGTGQASAPAPQTNAEPATPAPVTDEDLLNGPAHSAEAPSQDDIDKLFDDLPAPSK